MWASIALVVAAVALWLWLRSLGPGKPAGHDSVVQAAAIHKTDVRILYGTQTGNAASFAKTLLREAHRFKLHVTATDLEEYSGRHLADETVVIFVVSTYGEGDPPDTMRPFFEWLLKEASESDVNGVKFAVFGLGDRQYKYFASMGVKVDELMQKLGGERICGLGTGDAGQDMEESFDQWRQELWPAVGQALGVKLAADSEEPVEPELKLRTWTAEDAAKDPFPQAAPMMEPTQAQPASVTVELNEELLTNTTDRSTRLISFSIDGTSLSYQAGDHLGILPCNTDSLVDEYIQMLGVSDPNEVVSIADHTGRNQLPTRQPVRLALKWFIDLAGPPKKAVLRAFAHYCTDPNQKQELLQVLRTNDAAVAQFHKLQHSLRNVLGFLKKYNSCKVPLGHFLELMPRLAPRYFSISSDQLRRSTSVRVTVAVVQGGVCTSMLANVVPGDRVHVFVRKSTFHIPLRDKKRPLIMIGPGTGVAPLIGFCERREAWLSKGHEIGPAMLFFGCRSKSEDFIHQQFLESCLKTNVITSLDVAFSRDQAQKVYVQHRIAQRASEVWNHIQAGANIYICGDARHMAKDVEKVLLEDVFQSCGQLSCDAAAQKLKDLQQQDRYLKDVWSA